MDKSERALDDHFVGFQRNEKVVHVTSQRKDSFGSDCSRQIEENQLGGVSFLRHEPLGVIEGFGGRGFHDRTEFSLRGAELAQEHEFEVVAVFQHMQFAFALGVDAPLRKVAVHDQYVALHDVVEPRGDEYRERGFSDAAFLAAYGHSYRGVFHTVFVIKLDYT